MSSLGFLIHLRNDLPTCVLAVILGSSALVSLVLGLQKCSALSASCFSLLKCFHEVSG